MSVGAHRPSRVLRTNPCHHEQSVRSASSEPRQRLLLTPLKLLDRWSSVRPRRCSTRRPPFARCRRTNCRTVALREKRAWCRRRCGSTGKESEDASRALSTARESRQDSFASPSLPTLGATVEVPRLPSASAVGAPRLEFVIPYHRLRVVQRQHKRGHHRHKVAANRPVRESAS
jgi:hypothetical protein